MLSTPQVRAHPAAPARRRSRAGTDHEGRLLDRAGQVSLVCGVVLAVLGLRFLFDAVASQIVLALPWRELPARPGIAPGLVGAAAGLGLVALGRRLARTREPSRG